MSASMSVDVSGLRILIAKLSDPSLKAQLEALAQEKAVAAMVGQAIAENFENEGPGWEPLKAKTIRYSVSKKMRKQYHGMSDKHILRQEAMRRQKGEEPHRKILQRTGLLKKTATIPGFGGMSYDKKAKTAVSGTNIYKTEGTNLIWGTDLVYAGVHNKGLPAKNIPKREFLKIPSHWMKEINDFVLGKALKIIKSSLGTVSK